MIFQHTWRLILQGKKTQTRRLIREEFAAAWEKIHSDFVPDKQV